MFTRPSLIKTQIKRNKKGKKVLMKTLGVFELHSLVDKTYNEFCKGKSIEKIFQENSVAKKHVTDFSILLLNKFLKEFNEDVNFNNLEQIKMLTRFAKLSVNDVDLGFVYCIQNNNKIKIGRSNDFLKRIKSYKSHIGDLPKIIRLIFVPNHTKFEKMIIEKLSNLGYTNEWFEDIHIESITSLFDL